MGEVKEPTWHSKVVTSVIDILKKNHVNYEINDDIYEVTNSTIHFPDMDRTAFVRIKKIIFNFLDSLDYREEFIVTYGAVETETVDSKWLQAINITVM